MFGLRTSLGNLFFGKPDILYADDSGVENGNTIQNETKKEEVATTEEMNDFEFNTSFLKFENEEKNKIYSPLSIKYALKMLNEGASGNTKAEIDKVVGNLSLTKYNNIPEVLSLANSIFIRDTFSESVKENFVNNLSQKYNAELKYDSFENADNANKWIDEKTFGIIKNVVSNEIVQDPECEMLLINALAIDMKWQRQFDFIDTYGKEFYLADGTTMDATTMTRENVGDEVSYYVGKDVTALKMDFQEYEDTNLEFLAIMPKEDLKGYIQNITEDDLKDIEENLKKPSGSNKKVNIEIPKFEFDYDLNLKEDLINLGIEDAFNKNADFSNISEKKLYIGAAIHKANIEFSEKGTKAAAVTVLAMLTDALMPAESKPIVVSIDHPFLYLIKDKETGEVWFVGTVYEPNSWEDEVKEYRDYNGI